MSLDYQALAAELVAGHPVTGAYNADAQLAADELNALNITRVRESMTGAEIFKATDPTEYNALTQTNSVDEKSLWLSFCAITEHDPAVGGLAQQFVVNLFGGGSNTVTNLSSLRQETISRSSELGFGANISRTDVEYARSI